VRPTPQSASFDSSNKMLVVIFILSAVVHLYESRRPVQGSRGWIHSCGGRVSSVNKGVKYPWKGEYRGGEQCEWIVQVSPPYLLTFMELDTEASYDKITLSTRPRKVISGHRLPSSMVIRRPSLKIVFTSDHYEHKTGFKIKIEKDINECVDPVLNHCTQKCFNTMGSYRCGCHSNGYYIDHDGKTCIDVDECSSSPDVCDHKCENTYGSYACHCNVGFELQRNKKTCKDIDECVTGTHECDHICVNEKGSYTCKCKPGYQLVSGKKCIDVDECASGQHKCEHSCLNSDGSYQCSCRQGFQLQPDRHSCSVNQLPHGWQLRGQGTFAYSKMVQPKQQFKPLNDCLDFCFKKCPKNNIDWDAVHHNSKSLDCICLKLINHKRFRTKPHMPIYAYYRNLVPTPSPPATPSPQPVASPLPPISPTPQNATNNTSNQSKGGFTQFMGNGKFDQYDKQETLSPITNPNPTLAQCKAYCTTKRNTMKDGDLWNTLTWQEIPNAKPPMYMCICWKNSRGMFNQTFKFKDHAVYKWKN